MTKQKIKNLFGKVMELTEEDLKPLKEENWEEVNRFLKEEKEWREETYNPKSSCPLRQILYY